MQRWSVHYTPSRFDSFPPLDTLPQVDAETALDAVYAALKQCPPMLTEPDIFCRVIVTVHTNGSPRHVLSVPLTAEGTIPLDWSANESINIDGLNLD